MKLAIYNPKNEKIGEKELPVQFRETVRTDLVERAVIAQQINDRQPYGAYSMAGKNASVRLSKRRRDYRGAYGRGASRIPRKVMSRRGTQFNYEAAFAPGTVKGRRAHPPKPEKDFQLKINNRELQKAIKSALSATLQKTFLQKRNHLFPDNYPFLLSAEFEKIGKTKSFFESLNTLGFGKELERAKQRKIRAGKGKSRGRKYKDKKGPLIVVSESCPLSRSARNIKGCEVVEIQNITCSQLAPGTHPGRLTLYTEPAIGVLENRHLFMEGGIRPVSKKSSENKQKKQDKAQMIKTEKTKPVEKTIKPKKASTTPAKKTEDKK